METGRGKKGKKAGWHMTLGLKDAIFAGIGVVGLMMMSFALGALAGRGDIYRAAYSWGLLTPNGPRWPSGLRPPARLRWPPRRARHRDLDHRGTRGGACSGAAPAPPAAVAAKPPRPGPVTGSIAPLPPLPRRKKKGKTGTTHRDPKSREEELRRVRQEVVPKLKFQNSFDTGPKPRQPKGKDHDKAGQVPAHPGAGSPVSDQQGGSGQGGRIEETGGQGDPQNYQRLQRDLLYRL